MRILLINQYYPPDTAATGQLLADVAEGLAERGHEVHVICSRCKYEGGMIEEEKASGQKHNYHTGRIYIHRIRSTGFGHYKLLGRLSDYLSFFVPAVIKALRMPRTDVCLVMTTPPYISITGLLLKRFFGTHFLLWVMDLYPEIAVAYEAIKKGGLLHRILQCLNRRIYYEAYGIISIGELMTEKLVESEADRTKIVTIHNWSPGECIKPMRYNNFAWADKSRNEKKITLMYCGNYGLGHDLDTLMKALQRDEMAQYFHLLLASNRTSRKRLKRLIEKYDQVGFEFLEPVPLDQLSDTLAKGDIHLVSQSYKTEGLMVPSKLYGIMAAGRAILYIGSEATEGAKIVQESGCGFVVSTGQVDRVIKALRRFISDSKLRTVMGKRGRKYYESFLGLETSVYRIVTILESVGLQQSKKELTSILQCRSESCDVSS